MLIIHTPAIDILLWMVGLYFLPERERERECVHACVRTCVCVYWFMGCVQPIQGVLNFMVGGGQGEQGTEQEVRHILEHSNLMSRSAETSCR